MNLYYSLIIFFFLAVFSGTTSAVNFGFGIDTGYYTAQITDEDVVRATDYAIQEVYGVALTKKIIYAKKKDDEGTRYQLTVSVKNDAKTVCKVMLFHVLDRYGELYMDSYDTLMDGAC